MKLINRSEYQNISKHLQVGALIGALFFMIFMSIKGNAHVDMIEIPSYEQITREWLDFDKEDTSDDRETENVDVDSMS